MQITMALSKMLLMGLSMAVIGCGKKKDAATTTTPTNPTVTLKGAAPAALGLGGQGTIDAGVMKFNVYEFAVSTSAACTSPITVFTSAAGTQKDMLSGPTFGSGTLAAGTYPCVMIEMSRFIADAPATSAGGCVANKVEQDAICGGGNGQTSTLIDGTAVTCSADATTDQHVALYITTASAGANGSNTLLPPTSETDTQHGLKLTNAFVVGTTDTAGTLNVASKNFFQTDGTQCGSIAPTFSFN